MVNIRTRVHKLEEAEGIGRKPSFVIRRVEGAELKRILEESGSTLDPERPMLQVETPRGIAVLVPMKDGTY